MAYTVKCHHCHRALYTVQRIKFPLDYRTFVPILPSEPIMEDPMCIFCERPFQEVPHDISWKKIVYAPLVTDKGTIRAETHEEPPEPPPKVRHYCLCGCGTEVKKEGTYVKRLHKARHLAGKSK